MPMQPGRYECPDCDYVGRYAINLGRHRTATHGTTPKTAPRVRKAPKAPKAPKAGASKRRRRPRDDVDALIMAFRQMLERAAEMNQRIERIQAQIEQVTQERDMLAQALRRTERESAGWRSKVEELRSRNREITKEWGVPLRERLSEEEVSLLERLAQEPPRGGH